MTAVPRPRIRLVASLRRTLILAVAILAAGASGVAATLQGPVATFTAAPEATAQTDPVPHDGDAADDPAVWLHPTDPAKSLVLGTDKRGGLHAYSLDGRQVQVVAERACPNNVDVAYAVPLGGRLVDLSLATVRTADRLGVVAFSIDPATGRLADVTAGNGPQPVLPVLPGGDPYGLCTYRSRRTGDAYVFVSDTAGRVEQHRIVDAGGGRVRLERVRFLRFTDVVEGCVVDDERGVVYLAEERVGVWRFPAEPDGGDRGALVAKVGEHGLTADVEGLALYAPPGRGGGYLIASSQGNHSFKVYDRDGENRFVGTIDPRAGKIDDVEDTDGIAVSHANLGPAFPKGLFVAQDGVPRTPGGRQNFKLYAWEDVAGDRLRVDPRPVDARRPATTGPATITPVPAGAP